MRALGTPRPFVLGLSALVCSFAGVGLLAAQNNAHKAGARVVERAPLERPGNPERVPFFLTDELPRVSGLSVTTSPGTGNGAGYDVEVDVSMTTTRSYGTAFTTFGSTFYFQGVPDVARLGDNQTTFSFRNVDIPLTGTTARLFTAATPNTTNTDFAGYLFTNIATGRLNTFGFQTVASADLPLPALSYGDGDTISQFTLTQASGTFTSTPAPGRRLVSRRWRASFTHTYPDLSAYNVRVASTCCSPNVGVGSPTRGTQATTGTLRLTTVGQSLIFSGSGEVVRATGSFNTAGPGNFSNVQTGQTTPVTTGPFSRVASQLTFSPNTFAGTDLDQVTATAVARPPLIAVPTAGAYGLATLALLLLGLGFYALRR